MGASGDLAPLAHLSLPLLGEGEVRFDGKVLNSVEGLNIAGLVPFDLAPKEGLALLNGLQASTALCIDALFQAEQLFEAAILAGSLSVDAARGSDVPFDDRIHASSRSSSTTRVAASVPVNCYPIVISANLIVIVNEFRILIPYAASRKLWARFFIK